MGRRLCRGYRFWNIGKITGKNEKLLKVSTECNIGNVRDGLLDCASAVEYGIGG